MSSVETALTEVNVRTRSSTIIRRESTHSGIAFKAIPLLVASVLALSGCAAGPGEKSGPDPKGTVTDQGVTKDTIKIGILGPYSGAASIYSKADRMAEALYEQVNEKGGINGRKIEIVTGDTNCDAASLQGIIRKFVEQDKVFMINGGSCSNAIVSAKPLIEQLRIPFLTVNAASATISNPAVKNLFHAKATVEEQIKAIAAFMESNEDAKSVAIAATSDEWGQGYVPPLQKGLDGSDLKISTIEQLDPQGGDSTPAIRKMINSGADMAAVFAYPQPMTVFLQSARPQGLKIPIVTGDGTRPEEQMGRLGTRSLAEGFFSVYSYTAPLDDARFAPYKELFTKANSNLTWDTVALEGAVSAEFNIAVLTEMGDELTWDNWIKTAETLKFDSTVSGPMAFKPFDATDPQSRRPGIQLSFSALDPKSTDAKVVVVKDWDEWLKASK
jgi:branched-chain amino acid transport system substrate-binding protein